MTEISKSDTALQDRTILALDTSSISASLALVQNQQVLASMICDRRFPHSQTLFSSIRLILKKAKIGAADVDVLVGITGPGSFTGLRVGMSALKGVALACKRPVFGMDAISASALGTNQAGKFLVLIKFGPSEYFIGNRQITDSGQLLGDSFWRNDFVAHHQDLRDIVQNEPESSIVLVDYSRNDNSSLPNDSDLSQVARNRVYFPAETLAQSIARYASNHSNFGNLIPYYLTNSPSTRSS